MCARLPVPSSLPAIDRIGRSRNEGVEMSAVTAKRAVATALAGVIVASAIGATASARTLATVGSADGGSPSVAPPPSSIAAPAGEAYEELRAPDQSPAQPTGESQPVDEPSPPSGFDLSSATIGAVSGAGLVLVLIGAGVSTRRRPQTGRHGTVGA
jgi:hypothetical protein